MFSVPVYEDADMGAYSIQVEQARRYALPAALELVLHWPAITGILVRAERTGVPACVAGQKWQFMMTSQFICTREEALNGLQIRVWALPGVPRGMPVVFRLRRGIVTNGTK
jgi:hypothetical protein